MDQFAYTYPTSTEIEGVRYEFMTDYRIGLICMRINEDINISDSERGSAIVALLFNGKAPLVNESLEEAKWFLQCGLEDKEQSQYVKDMDYFKDSRYISTSFMKDYGISLTNSSYMHWWEFNDLLRGLSEDTELSRIREIRNYDLSTVKDWKLKKKIIDAKNKVALEQVRTEEEQQAINEFERLFGD